MKKLNIESLIFFNYLFFSLFTLVRPGYNLFPFQLNTNLTYFLALFFGLIFGLSSLIKTSKTELITNIKNNPFYIIFLIFVLISFLFNVLTGLFDLYALIKTFSFFTIGLINYYLIPIRFINNKKLKELWIKFVIYSSLIISIIAILGVHEYQPFFTWNSFDEKILVVNLRSTASILFEPNIFAYYIMFGIYLTHNLKKYSTVKFVLIGILFYALFLSYGRGAWLCMIIYFTLLFYFKSKYKKTLIFLSFLSLMFLLESIISSQKIYDILSLDNPLSGRIYLWYNSIVYSLENIFGIGMSESRLYNFFVSIGFNYVTSHNVIIDSILTNGLIATFFYLLVFIFPIIKNIKVKEKRNLLVFATCVFIFLQFSPHNIGGLSMTALNTAIIFGLINIKSNNILNLTNEKHKRI